MKVGKLQYFQVSLRLKSNLFLRSRQRKQGQVGSFDALEDLICFEFAQEAQIRFSITKDEIVRQI